MPLYLKAHVFEITNPIDTKEGKKPIAVDNGPYTYKMHRMKVTKRRAGKIEDGMS